MSQTTETNSDFSESGSDSEEDNSRLEVVKKFFEPHKWQKMSEYLKRQTAQIYENRTFMRETAGLEVDPPDFVVEWEQREEKKRRQEEMRLRQTPKPKLVPMKRHRSPNPKTKTILRREGSATGFRTPKKVRFADTESTEQTPVTENRKISPSECPNFRLPGLDNSVEFWGFEDLEIDGVIELLLAAAVTFDEEVEEEAEVFEGRKRRVQKSREVVAQTECPDMDEGWRYPRRKVQRVNYAEADNLTDFPELDENLHLVYCPTCKEMILGGCIEHPLVFVTDSEAKQGTEEYSVKSCPPQISISGSGRKGAGMGAYADKFIQAGTAFGPYKGKPVDTFKEADRSGYSWAIDLPNRRKFYVDGEWKEYGNWMRFVNHPTKKEYQNFSSFQSGEGIYYVAMMDIRPGTELFVYYGDDYHKTLVKEFPPSPDKKYDLSNVTMFACEECELAFATEELLDRHGRRSHPREERKEKERKHPCGICDKVFQTNQHLQQHMLVHSGERPFQCQQCGKKFTKESHLNTHQRIVHEHKKEFICDVCGTGFGVAGNLKKHKRVHSGQRPYRCFICNKRFSDPSSLQRHHRVHSGEKPYGCHFCPEKFSVSGNCRSHEIHVHTKAFPHLCSECGKGFLSPGEMRKHQESAHEIGMKELNRGFG